MTKSLRRVSGLLFAIALAFMIGGASLLVPNAMSKAYADESGTSVLAFTSDIHNSSDDTAKNRLNTWLTNVGDKAGISKSDIELFGFCGDMGSASANESQFWTYTQSVMTAVDQNGITGVYTTGNHEFYNGKYNTTTNSVKNNFIKDGEAMVGSNYRIYCLGTDNWNNNSDNYTAAQISALQNYLAGIDNDKVVIILTHFPLHHWGSSGYWGGRTTANADGVIDVLNAATASGKKIVLLWGHNHSQSDTNYDEVFEPGSVIQWGSSSSDTKEFNFYYAAAGCMSGKEYGSGSESVKGKALLLTINHKNQLSFAYYDEFANNVTENGTDGQGTAFTEQDPVAVTGVSINQTSASVEVGKTTKLTATVEPADATNKAVSWASSDTSIATVSSDGRVRGVAQGTATITVTAGDTDTSAIFTDGIEVTVTPRSSVEQYFVITIDNYALTSNPSSEMTSNSSGYEYHGLEAITYNANDAAPWSTLWTLEEVDGVENGYYIKSYNGDYLSATYVRGSGSGYTGTLTVGDTQDVWVVDGGLEAWQGNGSYLKSTNASDNPRPADIYLTTRASNNSVDFFTVGSSSNYKTSKLVEPDATVEPVAVTGVEVEPATLEIEAGKSIALTANVLPAEADDKTVTWTSSDESVATVSNSGRVKGVSVGPATITATTNDGGYTGTCEVTVTPSSAPGIGYIITIGDYALSAEPSSDVLVNSTNYRYEGLTGVLYDGNTEPTSEILWLIEPTEGGYYIKSQDGQYLNAVSGSTLHSANADKYITHEEGSASASLNLFTVRSTGESSTMIDPGNQAEVRYIETDALSTGKDYIVGVTKDGASVYAIENVGGSSSADTGTVTFGEGEYVAASGDEPAYIVTNNTSAVWNYNSSRYLTNNSRYLSRSSSSPYVPRSSSRGSAVTYDNSNQRLSMSYSNSTYYLTNSNGTFGLNTSGSSAAQVRIFERSTVFNFKYIVQFTTAGVNYQSGKYAAGEIPVYSGATPTRADSEQYSYTFIGWSSDGGQIVYGPNDALPAVTGPVTYVAQFEAVPLQNNFLITFVDYDGAELQSSEFPRGEMPEYAGTTPTRAADADYIYTFSGWTPAPAEVIGEATYTATYDQTPRTYGEPTWTWASDDENGYTAATATFATKDGEAEFTKDVTDSELETTTTSATCTDDGSTVYTATVEFGDQSYTATQEVVIPATGHTPVTDEAVPATCTEDGLTEGSHCSVCGEVLVAQEPVPATGHDYQATVTEPTCTEGGYTTHTCSRCGDSYTDSETEALGHDLVHHDAKAATCTEPGWEAYDECSRCDYTTYTEIPATGHTPVTDEAVPATCTEDGLTEGSHCSVCGEVLVAQEPVPATGHDWGEPTWEWTGSDEAGYTEATATFTCANDPTHTITATDSEIDVVVVDATPETNGSKTFTASVTGPDDETYEGTKVVTIPATGYTWKAPVYEWAETEDGLSCSALMECNEDPDKNIAETVDATYAVTEPATCVAAGTGTYTATFSNTAFEEQTQEVVIPATGHTPVTDEAVPATCTEDGLTEGSHCSVCGEVLVAQEPVPALGHDWDEGKVTVEPTATSEGEMTYTCKRCGETKTEPIDKLAPTKNGWVKENGSWKYYSAGNAVNGWQKLPNGKWYHFTNNVMDHGWFKETNGKYAGKWFYLGTPGDSNTGCMITGWLKVNGYWYYLKPGTGQMTTGWQKVDGYWYYLNPTTGKMLTGWQKVDGFWYYLKDGSGRMVTGDYQINGKWYTFASSGRLIS
ncbi:Ig-like domain-containing protein [Slackia heliotrinireducens]|uniref:Ig-like domain-containing protein n=1 Tax=Slackia heliotrinireducens TaxID=84110 RepID=UPI0001A367CC|nr:Ig-like domain-containing protein [Slackia heliotrinireducens]